MTPETVVLDIAYLPPEQHPERTYDSAISAAPRKVHPAEVDVAAMNPGIDHGAPSRACETAKRRPESVSEFIRWHDRASPAKGHPIRRLRARQAQTSPFISFTNFDADPYGLTAKCYDFLKTLDADFISGQRNAVRPDAAIYRYLENLHGLPNAETADARGWQAHPFPGAQERAHLLVVEGALTEKEAA